MNFILNYIDSKKLLEMLNEEKNKLTNGKCIVYQDNDSIFYVDDLIKENIKLKSEIEHGCINCSLDVDTTINYLDQQNREKDHYIFNLTIEIEELKKEIENLKKLL